MRFIAVGVVAVVTVVGVVALDILLTILFLTLGRK